ncbi:16S rRNA (cytidine1402-2'-O)-methyltransferase [Breoghania corrubedonensis]|uniref:Ribosomal RNA small subunit methyltransferase I n=1 Tax=Breoghania corrubedonensis TaxID=665038 RepID=A0A2T5VHJ5_9HYPH|nr:16S rRNA (cytidine(1402)-2'-O)-methyltransferase [Breoghania corrubedonensis]PTW63231.1 16S rRNA (cytidine1402-2'-O)-methyltransferase [Breoghania corrubedonensis]
MASDISDAHGNAGGDADKASERHRRYAIGAAGLTAHAAEPGLHVVSTPIGNLGDITVRALETLAGCDLVACEDTRVTRVLMERYALSTHLVAYHEHNAAKVGPRLLAALEEGKAVAVVSDAGTPLLSDPGYRLVVAAVEAGHKVIPIPGASALLSALVGAGLPSDTVLFVGFLPPKRAARLRRLEELKGVSATTVFYESPRRLADTLADMIEAHGADHPACVARELTKRFETFKRGRLGEIAAFYTENPPKGELVIVLAPAEPLVAEAGDVEEMLREALAEMPVSAAAAQVAKRTGRDRKTLYKQALALRQNKDRNGDG